MPSISGLSWFGELVIDSLPPSFISHTQPLPKRPTPALPPLFLELVEAAKRAVDGVRDLSGRIPAGVGGHPRPELCVIPVAAAVVADGRTDRLRDAVEAVEQIVDALALELGRLLERRVQIGDVRLVMLSVMNLHRLRIDVRLERRDVIRKLRKFVCHRRRMVLRSSGSGIRASARPQPDRETGRVRFPRSVKPDRVRLKPVPKAQGLTKSSGTLQSRRGRVGVSFTLAGEHESHRAHQSSPC